MEAHTEQRMERLNQIYNPAFRRAFEIFDLGTTDSPVLDDEVLELASRTGVSGKHRVLEPCSGSGGVSRLLAGEFGCHVLGIDLVQIQLDDAERRAVASNLDHLIEYRAGDVVDYDYTSEAFDVAVDVFAWVHVADWPALFASMHRALRPGGSIMMYDAFVTPRTTDEIRRAVEEEWFDPGITTLGNCITMLQECGFNVSYVSERREQVLDNWSRGLSNLEQTRSEFVNEFGEDTYEVFAGIIGRTIGAHERGEVTAAQIVARKSR